MIHCLFERSGTFKKVFKELGYEAEDYDVINDFGQTDNVVDLFSEIEKAYDNKPSILDRIKEGELVFAFFPCTRFETQITMAFRGVQKQLQNWSDIQKLEYAIKLHEELHNLYVLIAKLFCVAIKGGWRMVVENPYSLDHYLTRYFPIQPKIIDKDRRDNGDIYKKPTQYWFVNFEPERNFIFEPIDYIKPSSVAKENKGIERSLIHPQYASRFVRMYVLKEDI